MRFSPGTSRWTGTSSGKSMLRSLVERPSHIGGHPGGPEALNTGGRACKGWSPSPALEPGLGREHLDAAREGWRGELQSQSHLQHVHVDRNAWLQRPPMIVELLARCPQEG
eukprot:scaffold17819_cov120-Isochrysis_galbana.AAC.3